MSNWELHLKKQDDGSIEARTESGAFVTKADSLDELKDGLVTEFGEDHGFALNGLDDDGAEKDGASGSEGSSQEESQDEGGKEPEVATLPPLTEPNPLERQVTELAQIVTSLSETVAKGQEKPQVEDTYSEYGDTSPGITKADLESLSTNIFAGVTRMIKEPTGRQRLAEIAKMDRIGNMLMSPADVIKEVMPALEKDPSIFVKIADEPDVNSVLANLYSVALVQRAQSNPMGLVEMGKPEVVPPVKSETVGDDEKLSQLAAAQRTLDAVASGANIHASTESAGAQSGDLADPVSAAITHLERYSDDPVKFDAEIARLDPQLKEQIEDLLEEQELIENDEA